VPRRSAIDVLLCTWISQLHHAHMLACSQCAAAILPPATQPRLWRALLLQEFVAGIEGLPQEAKEALAAMTPHTYIGNAEQQALDLESWL
jgi:hypothetical protein